MTKSLPILYKRTNNGAIQQWQIVVEGDSFYTVEGLVDGKLSQSKPTLCVGKNIGKDNETSNEQQALAEATRKWKKQTDAAYTTDIDQIDNAKALVYKPMLAEKHRDYKDEVVYPVYVQPKFDGARCIIRKNSAISRKDKEWVTIPHIQSALKDFFKQYPNAILDGELYNHELHDDFNKIMSLVKKTKPTIADLFESEKMVQFYVYDAPRIGDFNEKDNFSDRYHAMRSCLKGLPHIVVVKTEIADSEEDMLDYYNDFLGDGYEGLMIRMNKPYQNKRTKYLLKVKPSESEEFKILGIREGRGNKSGMAAHMDFRTKEGKFFTSNIKGTHEFLTELLVKADEYIGEMATVQFQNYTPDGIPRFPYVHSIRNYE